MPRALAAAALAVTALLLAACGGGPDAPDGGAAPQPRNRTVGTGQVEELLVRTQKQKSPGLKVGRASCPAAVTLADGTRFRCTLEIERVQAPYQVTLTGVGAGGGTGRFSVAPAKPIIDVTKVVALIRSKLQSTARAATVSCGSSKVRVLDVGAAVPCTIRLGTAVQKVRAVVRDLKGTVVLKA
jgi:hypothetical protein